MKPANTSKRGRTSQQALWALVAPIRWVLVAVWLVLVLVRSLTEVLSLGVIGVVGRLTPRATSTSA